jgi:DNA-binding NarL/FixJ family response regulator
MRFYRGWERLGPLRWFAAACAPPGYAASARTAGATTKGNPLRLTAREVEILRFLACNLTNKEIAASLRISPKTVDHHVVAVLGNLGVSTRKHAGRHSVTRAQLAQSRESVGEI